MSLMKPSTSAVGDGSAAAKQSPTWSSWTPRALLAWSLLYGMLQAYWAFVASPPQMSPVGVDLIVFSGWKAIVLCLAGAAITFALGRGGQRAAVRRALVIGAWAVSGLLVVAAALLLLDVVGGLLPGIGVQFFPLGFLSRTACLVGAALMASVAVTHTRRLRGACVACGRVGVTARTENTPMWARAAAYLATAGCAVRIVAQLVVGFDTGGLGVGVSLMLFEIGFVLSGTLLPLALVHAWGTVFPGWVPGLAGRRVPRWLVLGPAAGISIAMIVYFGMILTKMVATLLSGANDLGFGKGLPDAFYWVSVTVYWLWGVALGFAALSYGHRTRPRCHQCGN
ncbi:hypothetical protein [Nonomuraea longicatena]|uniref:Transmembrane protein n=1 Tax=Nonomuraea longicatena TaxID=83682 RepID=A0ABP4AQT5_9ACTN